MNIKVIWFTGDPLSMLLKNIQTWLDDKERHVYVQDVLIDYDAAEYSQWEATVYYEEAE